MVFSKSPLMSFMPLLGLCHESPQHLGPLIIPLPLVLMLEPPSRTSETLVMHPCTCPDARIGVWNTRSIVNKPSLLQSLIRSKNLDIACITETWLSSSVRDYEIAPHSYNIFCRDRNSRGGGVLIAVSVCFPSRLILASDLIEMVVVEVFLSPKVV